jgi:hypothetical protein
MLEHCRKDIEFGDCTLFTDKESVKQSRNIDIDFVSYIDKITNGDLYSKFMLQELPKLAEHLQYQYRHITHVLITQCDGYVLNADKWDDEFLNYDYIGAPFIYDENTVGNGGFSLRSIRLLKELQRGVDEGRRFYTMYAPEDGVICNVYRDALEARGIKFAPLSVARRFSTETGNYLSNPLKDTFGFHSRHFCKTFGIRDFTE